MTKADAAVQIFYVSKLIREKLGGDEEADAWSEQLLWTAHGLDPRNERYTLALSRETPISKTVKLRRLIDHPGTPQREREAALQALSRLTA